MFSAHHHLSTFHSLFFFFNDTATTEIYTLSLHDALPISASGGTSGKKRCRTTPKQRPSGSACDRSIHRDRKSTRLNSSHLVISYAVFCLKKKKKKDRIHVPETHNKHRLHTHA